MRVVFDTNVLARAHQPAHGPARRGLLLVATGSDVLILSQYLLQELRRILTYYLVTEITVRRWHFGTAGLQPRRLREPDELGL